MDLSWTTTHGDKVTVWRKFNAYFAWEWRWFRKARNGKTVAASTQGYSRRVDALVNAERINPNVDQREIGGFLWVHPGRRGGEVCIYGTRLSAELIATYAGQEPPEHIQAWYPYISTGDVELCRWWMTDGRFQEYEMDEAEVSS